MLLFCYNKQQHKTKEFELNHRDDEPLHTRQS